MNREILFKGKRKDNGEWAKGYLFDDGMINSERMFVGDIIIENYKGTACDEWEITGSCFYEVDPSTICQYTGITDNNGTKIWENDIVKIHIFVEYGEGCGRHRNEVGFICYDNIGMLSVRTGLYDEKPCYSDILREICLADVEFELKVIGNLFDNPELMGGVS